MTMCYSLQIGPVKPAFKSPLDFQEIIAFLSENFIDFTRSFTEEYFL